MKKPSTLAAPRKKNFDQKLTIGLDLGDRSSWYCVLNEAGEVGRVKQTPSIQQLCRLYCALTQVSEPVSFTATLVKVTVTGLPSAVPR
jgi:hypothetical protein